MRTRRHATSVLVLATAVLIGGAAVAARDATPRIRDAGPPIQDGELQIHPVYHGSLVLEHGSDVVYVDPWSQGDYTGLPEATLVLITDTHSDHFDLEMVAQLMTVGTTVVAPKAVGDQWGGVDVVLANGESTVVGNVAIEAVPMYNLERGPSDGQVYHDKGRGNGYVIGLGGQRIYISGDTECVPEMRALRDIDIAFVCMNLPYTMTPGEAAECVQAFAPRVVYPYHYRGSDLDVFTFNLRDHPEIEVRVVDWYAESRPR